MKAGVLDPIHWIGRKVAGRYRVVEELSRGGMGAVFLAVQEPLERKVALKIMLPGPAADAGARRRFIQEAQALSRIPHRNIVTIFDFGEVDGGSLFIAMEHVEGKNLRELLRERTTVPWQDTIPIFIGIARALSIAHSAHILHRDLKPENVMLVGGRCTTDDVRLLDFGLARTLDSSEQLTQVNAIPGTPNYIAPERVVSRADDPRSDLYSMGAIWFELLTGRLPFAGETMAAILLAHIQQALPSFADIGSDGIAPPEVEGMVRRLLAKRAEERWASTDEFLEELLELGEVLVGGGRFGRGGAKAAGARSLDDAAGEPHAPPQTTRPTPRTRSAPTPRPPTPPPSASRWTTSGVNASAGKTRFPDGPATSIPAPVVGVAEPNEAPAGSVLQPPAGATTGAPAAPAPRPATGADGAIAGKTSTIHVGKELITLQTEWNAGRRAFVTIATFKGRVLRRREVEVPPATPNEELRPRMEAAHGWFADEVKQLLAQGTSRERVETHASMFFMALEAYQRGDKQTALRTLESLVLALPDDRRVKNSHMKLLLELEMEQR
ncbi:MAG: serine/threonine protein kinase [Deltaproteobacteria bacterium]|nr:serine/threonine protein kinase [Deltaproteobacteria bacterium]